VYYGLRPENGMDPLSRGWITIIPLQNNKMTKNNTIDLVCYR